MKLVFISPVQLNTVSICPVSVMPHNQGNYRKNGVFVEPAGLLCFMPNQTKRLKWRKLYLWLIHFYLDKIWTRHLPVMRHEQVCGGFFVQPCTCPPTPWRISDHYRAAPATILITPRVLLRILPAHPAGETRHMEPLQIFLFKEVHIEELDRL